MGLEWLNFGCIKSGDKTISIIGVGVGGQKMRWLDGTVQKYPYSQTTLCDADHSLQKHREQALQPIVGFTLDNPLLAAAKSMIPDEGREKAKYECTSPNIYINSLCWKPHGNTSNDHI